MYSSKIFLTTSASSSLMVKAQFFPTWYPNTLPPKEIGFPLLYDSSMLQTTFALYLDKSSSATAAATVRNKSLFICKVLIFSFSNTTATPISLNSWTIDNNSSVLRANLCTDFVKIISIPPSIALWIIRRNWVLFLMDLPLIPWSAYRPRNS